MKNKMVYNSDIDYNVDLVEMQLREKKNVGNHLLTRRQAGAIIRLSKNSL